MLFFIYNLNSNIEIHKFASKVEKSKLSPTFKF